MRKAVLALVLIVSLTACGGGDEATNGDGGNGNGGGNLGGSSGGSRPARIPDALLTELTELEVEGFEKTHGNAGRGNAQITYVYQTPSKWGRKAQALVMVGDVPPGFGGKPDPETLKTNRRNLMSNLSRAHIENPDLVFETSAFKLSDGRQVLCTYSRSYIERKTDSGTSRLSAHSLQAWTFDDSRMLTVLVTPGRGGERVQSAVDQQGEITPEELLDAAKLVLEAVAPKLFAAD